MAAVSRDIELERTRSEQSEANLLSEVARHSSNHVDQESNGNGTAVQAVERPTKQYQMLLLLSGFFMTFHVIGINSVYGIFQVSFLPNKSTREVPVAHCYVLSVRSFIPPRRRMSLMLMVRMHSSPSSEQLVAA